MPCFACGIRRFARGGCRRGLVFGLVLGLGHLGQVSRTGIGFTGHERFFEPRFTCRITLARRRIRSRWIWYGGVHGSAREIATKKWFHLFEGTAIMRPANDCCKWQMSFELNRCSPRLRPRETHRRRAVRTPRCILLASESRRRRAVPVVRCLCPSRWFPASRGLSRVEPELPRPTSQAKQRHPWLILVEQAPSLSRARIYQPNLTWTTHWAGV